MASGMASIYAPESGSTRMKTVESLVDGETPSSTISSGVMEWIVMLPAVSGFGVELLPWDVPIPFRILISSIQKSICICTKQVSPYYGIKSALSCSL